MIGSMLYALTSMTLGIVVTRLVGDVEGGIFLFAFSTLGQQLYIISYFGMQEILWSVSLGVLGVSCFWSIKELKEQEIRVAKGWFPKRKVDKH